jgi:hypothetical protein
MNKTTEALKLAEWALLTTQNALLFSAAGSDKSMYVEAINDADKALAAIRDARAEQIPEWVDVDDYEEPVAWVGEFAEPNKSLPIGTPLYVAPVDAKAIRAEALEEAAKVCDELIGTRAYAVQCAAAIRGLK